MVLRSMACRIPPSLSVQCLCCGRVEISPFLCLLQWLFSIVTLTKLLESKCKIVYTFFVHSLSSETVLELITLEAPVF